MEKVTKTQNQLDKDILQCQADILRMRNSIVSSKEAGVVKQVFEAEIETEAADLIEDDEVKVEPAEFAQDSKIGVDDTFEVLSDEVESAMITKIGYDRKRQTLRVEFREGQVYDYPAFPEREWEKFLAADSFGKHFNQFIKPTFGYQRVKENALRKPCCEHPEPNPTCNDECYPCDEWCCPGGSLSPAQRKQRLSALAGGMERGKQLMERARKGAATSGSLHDADQIIDDDGDTSVEVEQTGDEEFLDDSYDPVPVDRITSNEKEDDDGAED